MEKGEKPTATEKKTVKKGIEGYAKSLQEKLTLKKETGEKFRKYTENLAVDARDFSLSFLPEKTQKHILNMNREALLALQSVIEQGVTTLDKPAQK
jgi:hypothetical protein